MKLILLLIFGSTLFSQFNYHSGASIYSNMNYWNNKNQYSGRLFFKIDSEAFTSKLTVNLNSEARFNIGLKDFFVETANGEIIEIINAAENISPDIYRIMDLANIDLSLKLDKNIRFKSKFNFYKQENRITKVDTFSTVGIRNVADLNQYTIYSDIGIEFFNENLSFNFGFHNLNLVKTQNDLRYDNQLNRILYFEGTIHNQYAALNSYYNELENKFKLEMYFDDYFLNEPIQMDLEYHRFGKKYLNTSLELSLKYQLNEAIEFNAGYRKMLTEHVASEKNKFLSFFDEHHFDSFMLSDFFRVGTSINLSARKSNPFYVKNLTLDHDEIFRVKAEYYMNNPLGYIEIANRDDKAHSMRLKLTSEDNSILYTSNSYNISANQFKLIPFYSILTNIDQENFIEEKEINIYAIYDDEEYLLKSFRIDMYSKTSWSGDIKDLVYFIKSNNLLIKNFARENYRLILQKFDDNTIQSKFKAFKEFLNKMGEDFKYMNDPVNSFHIDQVQHVEETLALKSGDCEDLVTYLTSILSSVGHESALISILPENKAKEIGHVFLMINTNIASEYQNELGLNDFNSLIRNNLYGQKTIWLPFEVTIFNEGFEKAHQLGAKQYYEEVIEKNGVQKGKVIITDLNDF